MQAQANTQVYHDGSEEGQILTQEESNDLSISENESEVDVSGHKNLPDEIEEFEIVPQSLNQLLMFPKHKNKTLKQFLETLLQMPLQQLPTNLPSMKKPRGHWLSWRRQKVLPRLPKCCGNMQEKYATSSQ